LREQGDYSAAREAYSEIHKSYQKGLQTYPEGEEQVAQYLRYYLKNLDSNPSVELMYSVGMGIFLQESGHLSEASVAFEQAKQLDPLLDSSVWGSPSAQAATALIPAK
jgi:tetratricopeptide (TPR) repeat protein